MAFLPHTNTGIVRWQMSMREWKSAILGLKLGAAEGYRFQHPGARYRCHQNTNAKFDRDPFVSTHLQDLTGDVVWLGRIIFLTG